VDRTDDSTRYAPTGDHGPSCLAPDCPCRDPRIVSRRRAGFFAYLARERGQSASRMIRPQPDWRLPAT
jgi:hypothetical protein